MTATGWSPTGAPGQTLMLPLAGLHLALGCHPAPAHGWSMPLWYRGALDEQTATREGAGVFDRSHLGRFYVTGERAAEVLSRVLATDPARVPPGGVQRAVACRPDGTVLDIPTLCHLDEGRWLVVAGPRGGRALIEQIEAAAGDDVFVHDRQGITVLISLQGPRSVAVLGEAFGPSLATSVAREQCRELLLGSHRAALMRTSHVGEDGYWLLLSAEEGEALWRVFLDRGATSAGLAAHDALRLEAGVIEAPHDTPAPASPLAAGLGALVDLDGARDFPGAGALRAAGEPERRLVGLHLEGSRLAHPGSRVLADGEDVGACVAAGFSPALASGIAIAYLPPRVASVEVDADGQRERAAIVPLPFVPPR